MISGINYPMCNSRNVHSVYSFLSLRNNHVLVTFLRNLIDLRDHICRKSYNNNIPVCDIRRY